MIARKPQGNAQTTPGDDSASRFISGAGQRAAATAPAQEEAKGRVPAMIRFDAQLLGRIDAAAKRRGISRSAWVQYTLSQALDDQEQKA